MSGRHIALITCSTRPHRINPLISTFVQSSLQFHMQNLPSPAAASSSTPKPTLETIDLASPLSSSALTRNLLSLDSLDSEPGIPAQLPSSDPSPHYTHESTRAWSALIRRFDAFIFVTPQYNWSFPAPVKHVLDLLYHEWTGKVGWVISYGNRGGNLGRGQLEQVLKGLHMRPVLDGEGLGVELKVPVKVGLGCIERGDLAKEVIEGWRESGMLERLEEGMRGMLRLLDEENGVGEG